MYYINTLKRELVDTNAYKLQPSLSERVIVDGHGCHTALHFGVKAKENQDKVPTLYWLPKLHKKPYKARFIANSSSCTTTELSNLLTSCLTAVKKHVIKYCEKVYERSCKNLFWSIKNSGEILDKLKAIDFNATSLSTYDFSTLYTTLPYNLINDKLIDLIERTFQREGSPYLACNDRNAFLLQKNLKNIMHGRVKMYVMRCPFCWTTFLFHLAPSSIDKKLGFLWALIVLPRLQIYSCFVMRGTL